MKSFISIVFVIFCAACTTNGGASAGVGTTGTLIEVPPAPKLPVYGQTIPVPVDSPYHGTCAGVSESGVAACTTFYSFSKGLGRNKRNYYRHLAIAYNVNTGAVVALQPLPGDTDVDANVITLGGRIVGVSMQNLYGPRVVEWDASGVPTLIGVGEVAHANDVGQHAIGNQLCTVTGCVTVPNAYEIHALSNTGYVASYISEGGHYSMCRASDYAAAIDAEDMCSEYFLSEFGVPPTAVAMNSAGVVAYHNVYGPDILGVIALPGQTLQDFANYWGVPLAAINELGVSVGGSKIVHADGTIDAIPQGVYSEMRALGINSSGVIVGQSKSGAFWRAFVYFQ